MNTIADAAIYYHEVFLSFVAAGFTPEQALELTKNQQTLCAQMAVMSKWVPRDDH